jgi:hypothetical protein
MLAVINLLYKSNTSPMYVRISLRAVTKLPTLGGLNALTFLVARFGNAIFSSQETEVIREKIDAA